MNQIQKMINERYISKEKELTEKFISNIKSTKAKIYNDGYMANDQSIVNELYKSAYEYAKSMSKLENKKYGIKKEVVINSINPENYANEIYGSTSYDKSKSIIDINFSDFMKDVIDSKSQEETIITCLNLSSTIFHECYHQCQHYVCRDMLMKDKIIDNEFIVPHKVFSTSVELALNELMFDDYYSKSGNYFKILFERDARVIGYKKTFEMMEKIFDNPSQYMNKSIYTDLVKDMYLENEKMTNINGDLKDRLLVNIQQLETVFVTSPEKLADFPALSLAFNTDGHIKSLDQIAKDFNMRREIIKNNKSLPEDVKKAKANNLNDLYSEVYLNTIGYQSDESIKESIANIGIEPIKELSVLAKNYSNKAAKEQVIAAKVERKFLEDNPQLNINPNEVYEHRINSLKESDKERLLLINRVSKYIGEPDIEEIDKEAPSIDTYEQDVPEIEVKENASPKISNFTTFSDFYLTQMRDLRDSYKKREESLILNRDYYRELLGEKSKDSIEEKEIKHDRRGN